MFSYISLKASAKKELLHQILQRAHVLKSIFIICTQSIFFYLKSITL